SAGFHSDSQTVKTSNSFLQLVSPHEHQLRMQALDQRAQESNMEYWLNPHCPPRCDRNYGHPV
uniref:Uncharacterized protein n=1 Tax=Poecilia latipinna TaxID=48699 RepID=A0A3B3V0E8_9TELE